MSKVKVTGNENVKIVFCSYLLQKWIDYVKAKPQLSAVHSTHIVEYISPAEMLRFCDI